MIESCYRNEMKYIVSSSTKQLLSRRLKNVLKMDPHADENGYLVKSVYFDDFYDGALMDNLMGSPLREKFRIRYYNDDTKVIHLEKKVKVMDKGLKRITRITLDEAMRMINGEYGFLKDKEDELLKEFYVKAKQKGLRAKIIVVYRREPYVFQAGNVRVTLDDEIKNSTDVVRFFDPSIPLVPQNGGCLMEVKFDHVLPDLVRDVIQTPETRLTAHSKYGISRLIRP
ncbi:MAG: hypothetical protein A2Y20_10550 [Firmicutes bacterium GWF2_51_9]|nr:polyphosphate polymerase domain-containing protein [Erysipelotrichaceae bacterium]OGS53047.1 MAG: hypothetical protein A2Y20_10550 [Firmicutes bacterium GWF2_51_9]HAM62833.1 molecular chaperone [Erysipelotrichaceae bacterium]